MMGTLATGLAGRKIPTHTDRYVAEVEGDVEDVDGVLRISRIRVAYTLKVPAGKAEEAREVFESYITQVPGGDERVGLHRDHPLPGGVRARGALSDAGPGSEEPGDAR